MDELSRVVFGATGVVVDASDFESRAHEALASSAASAEKIKGSGGGHWVIWGRGYRARSARSTSDSDIIG